MNLWRTERPDPAALARQAAQDWLPIADIRDGCLFRPDGGVVAGVSLAPYPLVLKSERERAAAVRAFQEAVNGITVPWQVLSLFRPVDLDAYLGSLDQALADAKGRRREVLRQYADWVTGLARSGETVERRYYLLMTRTGPDAVALHRSTLRALVDDLGRIRGFEARVLDDAAWRELLFLAFHAGQAAVEAVPDGVPARAPLYPLLKEAD